MPQAGFCIQCQSYVWVAENGTCQYGHPATSVRGLYEAVPTGAIIPGSITPVPPSSVPATAAPAEAPAASFFEEEFEAAPTDAFEAAGEPGITEPAEQAASFEATEGSDARQPIRASFGVLKNVGYFALLAFVLIIMSRTSSDQLEDAGFDISEPSTYGTVVDVTTVPDDLEWTPGTVWPDDTASPVSAHYIEPADVPEDWRAALGVRTDSDFPDGPVTLGRVWRYPNGYGETGDVLEARVLVRLDGEHEIPIAYRSDDGGELWWPRDDTLASVFQPAEGSATLIELVKGYLDNGQTVDLIATGDVWVSGDPDDADAVIIHREAGIAPDNATRTPLVYDALTDEWTQQTPRDSEL